MPKHSNIKAGLAAIIIAAASFGCEPDAINGYFTLDPFLGPPVMPPSNVPGGVLNGHFDLDTSVVTAAAFPSATVTYHVHEYDKVNKTTTIDFFNLSNTSDSKNTSGAIGHQFDNVTSVGASTRFRLNVINAALNRGGIISINDGAPVRVEAYQASQGSGPVYTLGTPRTDGDVQLSALKVAFDPHVQAKTLLVPTAPVNCVIPNRLGPNGEYRDGALIVQAVDASSGAMIWEGIIYNHYMTPDKGRDTEICY